MVLPAKGDVTIYPSCLAARPATCSAVRRIVTQQVRARALVPFTCLPCSVIVPVLSFLSDCPPCYS